MMMEGYGDGSVLVNNGPGCGSGRPKNIRILMRVRNAVTLTSFFKDKKSLRIYKTV
jgi:hypothetical protein